MLDISTQKKKGEGISPQTLITESEISGLSQASPEKISKIFSLIILAVFLAMSIFVFALASSKQTLLKNKEANYNNLKEQLNSDQDLKQTEVLAQQFETGLKQASQFLSQQASWSILFKELQKITPADVLYRSFNVNEKTLTTTLSGEAGNYNNLALFLAALRSSDKLSDVKLISASQTETEGSKVSFNLEFKIEAKKLTP